MNSRTARDTLSQKESKGGGGKRWGEVGEERKGVQGNIFKGCSTVQKGHFLTQALIT